MDRITTSFVADDPAFPPPPYPPPPRERSGPTGFQEPTPTEGWVVTTLLACGAIVLGWVAWRLAGPGPAIACSGAICVLSYWLGRTLRGIA